MHPLFLVLCLRVPIFESSACQTLQETKEHWISKIGMTEMKINKYFSMNMVLLKTDVE